MSADVIFDEDTKMIKKTIFILLFGICVVHADSIAPPSSYTQFSNDQKFIFVMLAPKEHYNIWNKVYQKKLKSIRDKYKKSGLYNIATNELLWEVDFYGYITLSPDNKHFIKHGPWASDSIGLTDIAFTFYKKNKLIKQYRVNELVKDKTQIKETVSHYFWESDSNNNIKKGFSENGEKYTLITCDNIVYEFEVDSGNIINQYKIER